jgi:hypothetical protein
MGTPIESTSGHSLQELMSKKTVYTLAPAFLRVNLRAAHLHHLWEVITFVRLATCSRILCGMELVVVPGTHAVPSIPLHGSTSNCHNPPLMTLR